MLGECEKPSFYIDNCCFTALGIFFVLTCASLFITIFLLYGQGGGSEISEKKRRTREDKEYAKCVETEIINVKLGFVTFTNHFK